MTGRWGDTPLAGVAICLALGITGSHFLHQYHFAGLVFAAAAVIGAAALALFRQRLHLSLVLGLSAIGLCGLLLSLAQRDAYAGSDIRALLSRGEFPLDESLAFDGCVVDESRRRGEEMVATLELRALRKGEFWRPCRGGGLLRMPAEAEVAAIPRGTLQTGDRVRGWATWRMPRNFKNPGAGDHVADLRRRGISVIGRTKSVRLLEVIPADCASPWGEAAAGVRNALRDRLQVLVREGRQREASILSSVVIGDYSDLDATTRETFQNTGTYHVLVVSGLHVAWIAAGLVVLLRLLRVPGGLCRVLSATGILFYTCVVGFQASISRCMWMFILYLIGQSLFRRAAPTNILFASALLLLSARPDWLQDAGFQLSFLSVMAICQMAVPLIDREFRPLLEPLRHAGDEERLFLQQGRANRLGRKLRCRCELAIEACEDRWNAFVSDRLLTLARSAAGLALIVGELILVSLSIQIWLELVLAYHFNRLSWISPLANLVAVPISSLVLAAGVAAACLGDVPYLARPALEAAGLLASFLFQSNQWMASVSVAWQRCPTPPFPWVLSALAAVFAWCFMQWRRLWLPCLGIAMILGVLSAAATFSRGFRDFGTGLSARNHSSFNGGSLRLTFLDVGEGDSAVVRFPDRRVWVVDAGGVRQGTTQEESLFDIGEAVVSRYLWWEWIGTLDRLSLSHADVDHSGGMSSLLRNFRTDRLDYGEYGRDPLLIRILSLAGQKGVQTRRVLRGGSETLGGVEVQILNPTPWMTSRTANENSVVLRLSFGNFSALLTGDLERAGEADLVSSPLAVRGQLLKVAHHGSRSATLAPLLERVRPNWGVISVGRNNPFGHPSQETMSRLLAHGVRPLLTLDYGAITFETDGSRYVIESYSAGVLEEGLLPPQRR